MSHSLVSPAAATLNATEHPAPLCKVQLNRFTLTELYDQSPQALHWGAWPAVLGFSPAIDFPPHPPSQLPYFSGMVCSGTSLSGHFLLLNATP